MRKLLGDYPLNKWIDAADRCESCGARYQVKVTYVDETEFFGDVEWKVDHIPDCPEGLDYDSDIDVIGNIGTDNVDKRPAMTDQTRDIVQLLAVYQSRLAQFKRDMEALGIKVKAEASLGNWTSTVEEVGKH